MADDARGAEPEVQDQDPVVTVASRDAVPVWTPGLLHEARLLIPKRIHVHYTPQHRSAV